MYVHIMFSSMLTGELKFTLCSFTEDACACTCTSIYKKYLIVDGKLNLMKILYS